MEERAGEKGGGLKKTRRGEKEGVKWGRGGGLHINTKMNPVEIKRRFNSRSRLRLNVIDGAHMLTKALDCCAQP